MTFTILDPSEGQLSGNKSDAKDGRFGGQRKVTEGVGSDKDYTARSGEYTNKEENPVDETSKDIDEMTEPESRKREFSRREETSNVQENNEADFMAKSDPDNRPKMDEGNDAVQVPEASDLRQRSKANRWQYDTSNTYEGEIV